jgi:large subunit ribosomal protein L25
MQSKHTLEVQRRERTGSRYAKRDREAGRLPAILYGHGVAPVSLSLHAKDATKFFQSGERIFTIELKEEGVTQMVFLKDLQFDYLGTNIVHVDLTRVDLEEEIESQVPIHLIGEAPGAKAHGAVVVTPVMSLTVRCKVADLPDHIDVDISEVNVGDAVHARSVALPSGINLESDPDDILYSVEVHVVEEEPTAEAEAVEAEDAEPEVITERKKEGEEGED